MGNAFVVPMGLMMLGVFALFMWLGALITGKVMWKLGQGYVSLEGRLFVFFVFLMAAALATHLVRTAIAAAARFTGRF
jgi:hypothetical protein